MITATRIQELQVRIARLDDQQAYKELFTSLYGYLFAFAKSLVKAKEPAEEIISDVFIKVWERRKALEHIDNLKVYLYVSTRNFAYNYLEKQRKFMADPLDGFEGVSLYLDPEQLLITSDMVASIQKAVDQLPPKCKIIFKLAKEDGLKYREIAEILNITSKTVENQLAIALEKLGNLISFDIGRTIASSIRHHNQ